MSRITLNLSDLEKKALLIMAKQEFRELDTQAIFIIHRELQRQGMITLALGQADIDTILPEQLREIR